jgi:hypothetical protein
MSCLLGKKKFWMEDEDDDDGWGMNGDFRDVVSATIKPPSNMAVRTAHEPQMIDGSEGNQRRIVGGRFDGVTERFLRSSADELRD